MASTWWVHTDDLNPFSSQHGDLAHRNRQMERQNASEASKIVRAFDMTTTVLTRCGIVTP